MHLDAPRAAADVDNVSSRAQSRMSEASDDKNHVRARVSDAMLTGMTGLESF